MKVRTALRVLVLFAATAMMFGGSNANGFLISTCAAQTPGDQEVVDALDSMSRTFERVAETIAPSVVSISSVQKVEKNPDAFRQPNPFGSSPFRDFFGDDLFERFFEFRMPRGGMAQRALGSGVVVDEQGHILTNNHVVQDSGDVTVVLNDGKKLKAKVVGTDPKTDLAVISVDGERLKAATLGDSSNLRVGQWVVAVGNPFNLSQTITAGIVSAKGRANVGVADYEDFIQTDAAINPGNSGGPLVNLKGEVVGINTAIFSRSGGNMGIGFAIPINMAKSIMRDLIDHGQVTRGWLGVVIQNLDEGLAESFGYRGTDGALVSDVNEGSPAEEAGFKQGDIILEFDGKTVRDANQLKNLVAEADPKQKAGVVVFREGKKKSLTVKLGEMPAETIEPSGSHSDDLGLHVEPLTPQLGKRLGAPVDEGVAVTAVRPGGLAELYGLRPGDVILEVQGRRISDPSRFEEEMGKADLEKGVRMTVLRDGNQFFLFLRKME